MAAYDNAAAVPLLLNSLDSSSPVARAHAARELAEVAHGGEFWRERVAAAGAIPKLVAMLSEGRTAAERQHAARALAEAAGGGWEVPIGMPVRDAVVTYGAVPPLVALLSVQRPAAVKAQAARAIAAIAAGSDAPCDLIAGSGGIPPLVALLGQRAGGSGNAAQYAATALANLTDYSGSDAIRESVAAAGAIASLVDLVRCSGSGAAAAAAGEAARALAGLARCPSLRSRILAAGAAPPLAALLSARSVYAAANAAQALARLAASSDADCHAIIAAGALPPLLARDQQRSSRRCDPAAEWAIFALEEIVKSEPLHGALLAAGAVPTLTGVLTSTRGDSEIPEFAAGVLSAMNSAGEGPRAAVFAAMQQLVAQLSSADRSAVRGAAIAISLLAKEPSLHEDILAAGVLPLLVRMVSGLQLASRDATSAGSAAVTALVALAAGDEAVREKVLDAGAAEVLEVLSKRARDDGVKAAACVALRALAH